MAEERTLPGWPKKRLVREVRRTLKQYGITPPSDKALAWYGRQGEAWRAAWEWAAAVARSYWREHWPLPSEVASQYLLLLLTTMRKDRLLRLPPRVQDVTLPSGVRAILGAPARLPVQPLALPFEGET